MICSECQATLQAAISHFRLAKNQDGRNFVRVTSNDGPTEECIIKDHHRTWSDFMESIQQGCHICLDVEKWIDDADWRRLAILWSDIESGKIPNAYGNAASHLLMKYQRHQDSECFTLSFEFLTTPETSNGKAAYMADGYVRQFHAVLEIKQVIARSGNGEGDKSTLALLFSATMLIHLRVEGKPYAAPTRETSTWSLRAQRLAREWVSDCLNNHHQCRPPKDDTNWYPTRLLDLGESTEVRLIETKNTKPAGPYATVTHRWGHVDEDFVLNKQTHPLMIKWLPSDSLPRLFQDVISVARTLEVRYLWIDSLCIMQDKDDKADWEREASLMEKVYSHSYCNISAANAESCSRSLFNARDPQSVNPVTLKLNLIGDESGVMAADYFYVYSHNFWVQDVTRALVNTRAWVLQERILAPRVLHFGKRQLMWECCEKDASEVFPYGLHPELAASEFVQFKSFTLEVEQGDRWASLDMIHRLPAAQLLWNRIISNYSLCDLSRPEDKLVACSGVAKRFRSLLQDTYVAGMWRTNLETQLLWTRSALYTGSRPDVYRAPTWSWICLDGAIWPSRWPQDGCHIEVEDVHLSYATSDKTGDITDGWLRLRGALWETKIVKSLQHESAFDLFLGEVRLAAVLADNNIVSPIVYFDISKRDSVDQEGVENRVFSMVAHAGTETLGLALLLFEIIDEQRGVFQRIGMAVVILEDQTEQILSLLTKKPGNPSLPCAEFKDGKHSIIIV